MRCPPARARTLLRDVVDPGLCLEFGPIMRRVFDKSTDDVRFADYADRDVLAEEYADNKQVDTAMIPEIDYVVGTQLIDTLVNESTFDTIVASHVLEHVPDMVSWIAACVKVLKPGGILSLAVPDKRYTFDIVRRETMFSDVLAAWVEKRTKPTIQQIADHRLNTRPVRAKDAWNGTLAIRPADGATNFAPVIELLQEVHASERYQNCHCWVFTPERLLSLMRGMRELDVPKFEIASVRTTQYGQGEFFASLRKA